MKPVCVEHVEYGQWPACANIRFDVPEDGLPSIEDWVTTCTSILLDGLELQREPLDVCVGAPSCKSSLETTNL